MPKVKLLVLPECVRCKALKSRLEFYNTKFDYISCDDKPSLCDEVENLTGVQSYPMAIVLDINNKIVQVVHFAEQFEDVGKTKQLDSGVTTYAVHSIDQLVDYIIKL